MKVYFRIKPATKLYQDLRRDQQLRVALAPHLNFVLTRAKQYILEDPSDASFRALDTLPARERASIEIIGASKGFPDLSRVAFTAEEVSRYSESAPSFVETSWEAPPKEEEGETEEEVVEEPINKRRGRPPRKR